MIRSRAGQPGRRHAPHRAAERRLVVRRPVGQVVAVVTVLLTTGVLAGGAPATAQTLPAGVPCALADPSATSRSAAQRAGGAGSAGGTTAGQPGGAATTGTAVPVPPVPQPDPSAGPADPAPAPVPGPPADSGPGPGPSPDPDPSPGPNPAPDPDAGPGPGSDPGPTPGEDPDPVPDPSPDPVPDPGDLFPDDPGEIWLVGRLGERAAPAAGAVVRRLVPLADLAVDLVSVGQRWTAVRAAAAVATATVPADRPCELADTGLAPAQGRLAGYAAALLAAGGLTLAAVRRLRRPGARPTSG